MAEFYLFRSTTARLTEHLQHIEESGDTVVGVAFMGGEKHWVIVCRKGRSQFTCDSCGRLLYQRGGHLPKPETARHG